MPYIFGAPLKREDRKKYEDALLSRYNGNMEQAVQYVNDVTNSQLTRASGILSSVSILAGMSYFVNAKASLIIALFSIVLVASTLYLKWPSTPSSVGEAKLEFELMCGRCYYRAIANRICITLIILTVLLLLPALLNY